MNAKSGIRTPKDLIGKKVGVPEFQMTAPVWIRGTLDEHYGVPVDSVTYYTGGEEEPGRSEKLALDLGYADVRLYTNRMFDANVRLYLAFGYRIDREETSALGVTVHMSKPLRGAVPVA